MQLRVRGACTNSPSVRACAGLARPPPSLLEAGPGGERGAERRGGPALLDDEAAGQVLRKVLEELGGSPRAVGQLQLLQLLQLHQARQPGGGQQRAACIGREAGRRLSGRGPRAPEGGAGGGSSGAGQEQAGLNFARRLRLLTGTWDAASQHQVWVCTGDPAGLAESD